MSFWSITGLIALISNGLGGLFLAVSSPGAKRVLTFHDLEDTPANRRRDRLSRWAYEVGFVLLLLAFVLQVALFLAR